MKNIRFYLLILFAFLSTACSSSYEIEDAEEVVLQRKFTGNRINYYENGKILSIVHYKNDKKDSISTNFYDNGVKHLEVNYKNDKREGLYKWYHPDGKLYQEREYSMNKLHGSFKEYYRSGKLKYVKTFYRGQEISHKKQ